MNLQFEHTTPEELIVLPNEQLHPQADLLPSETRTPVDELPRILAELVIEEVSIDGMCGVY